MGCRYYTSEQHGARYENNGLEVRFGSWQGLRVGFRVVQFACLVSTSESITEFLLLQYLFLVRQLLCMIPAAIARRISTTTAILLIAMMMDNDCHQSPPSFRFCIGVWILQNASFHFVFHLVILFMLHEW